MHNLSKNTSPEVLFKLITNIQELSDAQPTWKTMPTQVVTHIQLDLE